ncbi:MAG: choice-of-anchor J domain-containing protein [Ferruginibacter sp.]
MQLTSTRTSFSLIGVRLWATVILFFALAGSAQSQILYSEGFTSVTPLPAGWASQNNSSPAGTTSWFQGVTTTFNAFSGPATSYIGANFNNVAGANVISNWLFMPNVTLTNGDVFTFYTRVPTGGGQFPDRLQVRMSTNGASTDVGTSSTSAGDFSTLPAG